MVAGRARPDLQDPELQLPSISTPAETIEVRVMRWATLANRIMAD
jgi:hypothetical protein